MKTFLLFLLLSGTVEAQNFAVKFTGANTNGTPFYWPDRIVTIGTNTTVPGQWVLMSRDQLNLCVTTNNSAYIEACAAMQADKLARFAAKLDSDWLSVSNSIQSIKSGSLTSAQRLSELNAMSQVLLTIRDKTDKLVMYIENNLD